MLASIIATLVKKIVKASESKVRSVLGLIISSLFLGMKNEKIARKIKVRNELTLQIERGLKHGQQ